MIDDLRATNLVLSSIRVRVRLCFQKIFDAVFLLQKYVADRSMIVSFLTGDLPLNF